MLFESITYQDNLPFEISFSNVGEENKHCHKEIEIVLVLRGVTHYQIYHMDYELNPGDLIIADVEDLHQIHDSSDDILLLTLHVSTKHFEHIYPNIRYMFFVCEECMDGTGGSNQILQSKLAILKHHIAKLALNSDHNKGNPTQLTDDINELVSILVNHFQGFFMEDYQYKTSREDISDVDLHRLSRITRYILLHYNQKISLEDVSNMEHLSSYYVSHLIKKTLGFNFQNFVNAIRLEFSEKLLVFSNLTLMQISEECGFSSPNYFNKCFSSWYGKTPAQYRKDYHPCERAYKTPFTKEEAIALLTPYLNVSLIYGNEKGEIPNQILISYDSHGGKFEDFWKNYGPKISINSITDILQLGYLEDKIREIHPVSFVLDESLLKTNKDSEKALGMIASRFHSSVTLEPHLSNLAHGMIAPGTPTAFHHVFNAKNPKFFLYGQSNALFTLEGLSTPFYKVYTLFSQLKNPQIHIDKNYAVVKSLDSISIILFNVSSHTIINAHVATKNLPEKFFLVRTEFSEKENCYTAISDLGSPCTLPNFLKNRIDTANPGK
ncbi:MAG: AraC family transcriptional regulator, partial [Anaerovorax sp.]